MMGASDQDLDIVSKRCWRKERESMLDRKTFIHGGLALMHASATCPRVVVVELSADGTLTCA